MGGRLVGRAVIAILAVALVGACGSDDDDAAGDSVNVTSGDTGGDGSSPTTDDAAAVTTGESGADGELVMLAPEPTQGLDPNVGAADASRIPMAMMYETLTELDESGEVVGSLAEGWEVSADGLTYTFTLRPDAAFSDGTPVTADDVVFSFERMQEGELMAGLLSVLDSVEAVDERTVAFTLSEPYLIFPEIVGRAGNAAILSRAAVDADPEYFTAPTATSGPWVLTDYVPASHMLLEANEHYYNPPQISRIRQTFSEDQTAHAAAVQSGSADIANVGYADAEPLRTAGITVLESDQLTPLFWGWDRTKPPFDDERVRQAFAFAVDREGRRQACWYGTGEVTYGSILRPWDPYYIELSTYETDSREDAVARAGELLDEAGWVLDGDRRVASGVAGVDDGTTLSVTVQYEGNWPAAECHTQVLQQNLADVGVEIVPESYDPAAFWGDVADGKFTMYHGGAGATGAADLYVNWFRTDGSLTALTTHLSDPEIDGNIDEALTATDPEQAVELFHGLEEWQAEELPMLVVGYQWAQVAVSDRVNNYELLVDHIDSRPLVNASLG